MEERRQLGFRQRPRFSEVLDYIEEGQPLRFPLPNRKATIYTSSHYWLDDFPQSTEAWAREGAPQPHTGVRVDDDFETADEGEGYRGRPFPQTRRPDFLRQDPDTDSEGPDEALRRNGMNPPRPPAPQASSSVSGRLGEAVVRGTEGIIAAGAAGLGQGAQTHGEQAAYQGLGRAAEALQRRAPQIIGRPSEAEELINRAGQRAQEVERAAARDIEQFAAEQAAAETGELVPLAAETTAAATEGGGALAGLAAFGGAVAEGAGEAAAAAFPLAEAAGMAAGVATGGAAALAGGAAYGLYQGGRWLLGGGNGGDAASSSESATDVRTLNGMQQGTPQQHLTVRQPRRVVQPQVVQMNTDSDEPPQAQQPRPQVTARPRRPPAVAPFGINAVQLPRHSSNTQQRQRRRRPATIELRRAAAPHGA